MNGQRAEAASKDGWVAFSDILISTICSVLFLQTLGASQNQKAQQFEDRLGGVERSAMEMEASAKAAATDIKALARALGEQPPPGRTPPAQPKPKPQSGIGP